MKLKLASLGILLLASLIAFHGLASGRPAVDRIFGQKKNFVKLTNKAGTSGGTGWEVVAPSGKIYTITNGHVCEGVDSTGIVYGHDSEDEGRTVELKIIEISSFTDLCILEPMPQAEGLEVARDGPRQEEKVFAIGFPALEPLQPSAGMLLTTMRITIPVETPIEQCTQEKHQILEQKINFFGMSFDIKICAISVDAYASTVKIWAGNSGSAVFNNQGKVVAVVFAAGRPNNAFMIRHKDLVKFLSVY